LRFLCSGLVGFKLQVSVPARSSRLHFRRAMPWQKVSLPRPHIAGGHHAPPELCTEKALSYQRSTRFAAAMVLTALSTPLKDLSRRLTYVGSFDNWAIIKMM
jgi:hypothetical protein